MNLSANEVADDDSLVAGCREGDDDAIRLLTDRHGALAQLTLLRELGGLAPLDVVTLLFARLRADPDATRGFSAGACSLRAYLSAWVRRQVRAEGKVLPRELASPLPTPTPIDRLRARETIDVAPLTMSVRDALARQPPNVVAIVRLRLLGLGRAQIAALLGASEAQVLAALERVASRLGAELDGAVERDASTERDPEDEDTALAFRVLLDASPPRERVRFCRRTESEVRVARLRAQVGAIVRALREDVLGASRPPTASCPDAAAIAGYVDGTMRGAGRARCEAHVTGCFSCLDEIGALYGDLRVVPMIREAQSIERASLVAAMGLAAGMFEPSTALADSVASRREPKSVALAEALARLGRACRVLSGGAAVDRETSGLVSRDVPSDDEAPLVAFEALALGDSGTAFRAIDEANAPAPVAARVRVLAAAAGGDAPLGHAWARAVKDGYDVDPGAVEDAECVLALGEGEALPREIVVERLRALVPDLVRVVLALHARPTR